MYAGLTVMSGPAEEQGQLCLPELRPAYRCLDTFTPDAAVKLGQVGDLPGTERPREVWRLKLKGRE